MEDLEYATTSDGQHVAFRVYSGGPGKPLLYLPGLLYSIESILEDPPYARLINGLAELRPLVLVERRGVAASDPLDYSQDVWEQWVADVVAVVDQLGAERASMIGSFFGANIALETAVRFPDRVASVIALHPRLFPPDTDHEAVRDRMLKVVDRHADAGRNELALAAPTRVSEPGFADWFVRVGRMAASPSSATQFWEAASRPSSLRARVGAIEAPVLLLCRRDYADLGGVDDLTKIAAEIPAGRCVVLEGADGLVNAGDVDGLVFEVAEFLLGERHSATTLRPVVSVLFTDVVGSTATARSMGDTGWRIVLDHHDRLIDRTVRRYGGAMVKATGDGALTIFDAPSRALHCAVALREQLAVLGLQVRFGVHLGEIERRGDDVAGVAVHLSSRVMSVGNAGDILTTAAVPLATLGGGFTFESRGQHVLKGFDDMFELYRLVEKD